MIFYLSIYLIFNSIWNQENRHSNCLQRWSKSRISNEMRKEIENNFGEKAGLLAHYGDIFRPFNFDGLHLVKKKIWNQGLKILPDFH